MQKLWYNWIHFDWMIILSFRRCKIKLWINRADSQFYLFLNKLNLFVLLTLLGRSCVVVPLTIVRRACVGILLWWRRCVWIWIGWWDRWVIVERLIVGIVCVITSWRRLLILRVWTRLIRIGWIGIVIVTRVVRSMLIVWVGWIRGSLIHLIRRLRRMLVLRSIGWIGWIRWCTAMKWLTAGVANRIRVCLGWEEKSFQMKNCSSVLMLIL